ncbi:MAG: DUF4340 domain-containing protein [Myxococcota bacterium]
MGKTVFVYATLLVLATGASWMRYTSDDTKPREGVVLVEAKSAELEKVVYDGKDLDVTFEMREDAHGRYPWVTTVENKKKKVDGVETTEVKTQSFKAGSAADKLLENFGPLMALRTLDAVDDAKIEAFGLKEPETTVTVVAGGRTSTLELGGETYGTKDRYVRHKETGKVYVVKDEPFKTLKFANTRLPERSLVAGKKEEIEGITLGLGGQTLVWTQKNKDDKAAAYWEREGKPGKDESFGNWIDKVMKLKSTGYVQEGEAPTDPVPSFDLTVRAAGKPAETMRLLEAGEDWFAQSESTRGMVKLSKGPASDVAEDVDDMIEGKLPPEEPKKAPKPPDGAAGAGGPPGRPPMPMSPMRPPTPPGAPK